MRLALALPVLLAIAGCAAPAHDLMEVPIDSGAPGHAWELAGADVSYNGTLELDLPMAIPLNVTSLQFAYWAVNGTSGESTWRRLAMAGCPTQQSESYASSGAGSDAWCDAPPHGHAVAHYSERGHLTGRVCVIGVPAGAAAAGADLQCRGFPYFWRCGGQPAPSFCDGRTHPA